MKENAIHLIEDVIQIAKWLCWDDEMGRAYAEDMKKAICKGKYGSDSGLWVQVGRAMRLLSDSDGSGLEELLLNYASAAYWHGENTGKYGAPDPEAHETILTEIEKLIPTA